MFAGGFNPRDGTFCCPHPLGNGFLSEAGFSSRFDQLADDLVRQFAGFIFLAEAFTLSGFAQKMFMTVADCGYHGGASGLPQFHFLNGCKQVLLEFSLFAHQLRLHVSWFCRVGALPLPPYADELWQVCSVLQRTGSCEPCVSRGRIRFSLRTNVHAACSCELWGSEVRRDFAGGHASLHWG